MCKNESFFLCCTKTGSVMTGKCPMICGSEKQWMTNTSNKKVHIFCVAYLSWLNIEFTKYFLSQIRTFRVFISEIDFNVLDLSIKNKKWFINGVAEKVLNCKFLHLRDMFCVLNTRNSISRPKPILGMIQSREKRPCMKMKNPLNNIIGSWNL